MPRGKYNRDEIVVRKQDKVMDPDSVEQLDIQGKMAIDLFLREGMSAREAIKVAYDKDYDEQNASKYFMKILDNPMLRSYYEANVAELRERGEEKSLWTRTQAVLTLRKLIDKTEHELYDDEKPLTMTRVNAIISAVKELNMMSGFITEKHQVMSAVVMFNGDDHMQD